MVEMTTNGMGGRTVSGSWEARLVLGLSAARARRVGVERLRTTYLRRFVQIAARRGGSRRPGEAA
jgi:hypothetical protein